MRAIRSDNGSEFKIARFDDFCRGFGLDHQYSSPYVPPQNGVVERKKSDPSGDGQDDAR